MRSQNKVCRDKVCRACTWREPTYCTPVHKLVFVQPSAFAVVATLQIYLCQNKDMEKTTDAAIQAWRNNLKPNCHFNPLQKLQNPANVELEIVDYIDIGVSKAGYADWEMTKGDRNHGIKIIDAEIRAYECDTHTAELAICHFDTYFSRVYTCEDETWLQWNLKEWKRFFGTFSTLVQVVSRTCAIIAMKFDSQYCAQLTDVIEEMMVIYQNIPRESKIQGAKLWKECLDKWMNIFIKTESHIISALDWKLHIILPWMYYDAVVDLYEKLHGNVTVYTDCAFVDGIRYRNKHNVTVYTKICFRDYDLRKYIRTPLIVAAASLLRVWPDLWSSTETQKKLSDIIGVSFYELMECFDAMHRSASNQYFFGNHACRPRMNLPCLKNTSLK